MGIVSQPASRIRGRFVNSALIAAGENDARTARKHEPSQATVNTAADDVFRAQHICFVKMLPRPPNAGYRRGMKNDLDATAGANDVIQVAEVAMHAFHAQGFERGILAANQRSHSVSACYKLLDDVLAEETPGAGDKSEQGVHQNVLGKLARAGPGQ